MWITIGFSAACGLSAWWLWSWELWPFAAAALMLGGIAAKLGKGPGILAPAVMLLGLSGGFLWFGLFQMSILEPILETDGQTLEASIRARDFSYETEYGAAVDGVLTYGGKPYQVRLYLDETIEIQPGDTLSGAFRFQITTPGGGKENTRQAGRNIFLLLYQEGEAACSSHGQRDPWERVSLLRRDLTELLEMSFPADTMPFAKALLMGDARDLSDRVDADLKVSGIRHVVSASGLHVSILFALVGIVTFRQRLLAAAAGFPLLLLFAALAGFSPSVIRSCMICGAMLLGMVLSREYDGPTALASAVQIMLLMNPLVITDVGFQLSVGSVAGIYLFSGPLRRWLRPVAEWGRLGKGFAASVSATLSTMAVTLPLSAYYFGTVSLIGIVTNFLTLWVISFIFYGIMGTVLLALFWQSGAMWLAGAVSWLIRYVLQTAQVLSDFPLAAVYTRNEFIIMWLVLVYLLLAVFLLGKGRASELACCVVLFLCICLIPARLASWLGEMRFTVLDVGQGQCLVFQSQGETVVVDCGGDSDAIAADRAAQTLRSQGITEIDALILTHWDEDHTGGVGELLSQVDTELLILPPEVPQEQFPAEETLYAYEPVELAWEKTKVQILPGEAQGNRNENSLCVLFETENCDILITGDRNFSGEQALLKERKIGKVNILVAGHHGAKTSVSPELLAAVRPDAVCISAGRNNIFGHPAPETLKRLKDFSCQVYRTDLQGDIIIRR